MPNSDGIRPFKDVIKSRDFSTQAIWTPDLSGDYFGEGKCSLNEWRLIADPDILDGGDI